MRVKEIGLLGSLISILICGGMLYAAEAGTGEDTESEYVFTLGEIVVTGEAEVVTQVTTIETIEMSGMALTNSNDLSSAIDTFPGVAISRGSRNEAYINVRGFSQRYVPIFYDGIPWYVPYDGYADAGEISTGTVSRISLTKGTASSLYGANTMAGVINIISMKPQKRFESSYGFTMDNNGYSGNLNLGSKMEKFYFMAGFSAKDYDAFRMSDKFTPTPAAGWFEDGGDRDNSYSNGTTTSLKIGFTPVEGHEYAIGYHSIKNEKGLPPTVYSTESPRYWRVPEWEKTTYYIIGDSRISDRLTARIRIYHDEYLNIFDAYDNSTYTTQNAGSSWHSTYDDYTNGGSLTLRTDFINKNIISFAYHYKDDVHQSQGDYDAVWEKYEGVTSSYGLEDAITISENMDIVLGVNLDIQKPRYANGNALRDTDNSWNGLAGMTYNFGDAGKLHLSVASKSRFPTLKELYSSYIGTSLPNPNLKKEQSTNYEIGWARALPWDSGTGITLFYSDVKDLIVSTRISGQNWYDNVGESRFQGIEFTFKTEYIPRNSLYLSYTYLDAENRTSNRTSDLLSESPAHQIYISDYIRVTDRFSVFAKAENDRRQKQQKRNGSWTELHSYWVVDLKALMEVSEILKLEAGIQNLFDRNYETNYGYPREGRTFFFGIGGRY